MPRQHREPASPFNTGRVNADLMFQRGMVAAISLRPKKWSKAHNADKMEEFFRKAARQKGPRV